MSAGVYVLLLFCTVLSCTVLSTDGVSARLTAPPVLKPHQVGRSALFLVLVVLGSARRCICVLRGKCWDGASEGCEWLDGVFRCAVRSSFFVDGTTCFRKGSCHCLGLFAQRARAPTTRTEPGPTNYQAAATQGRLNQQHSDSSGNQTVI